MTTVQDAVKILLTGDGKQLKSELDNVGKSAKKNLGEAQSSGQRFGSTLTKVGVGMIGTGAVIGGALLKAAEAASESDLAQQKLLNTIHNSPTLAGASAKAFNAQADALEKTTIYSHVATTSAQALLGQFKLNQAQIIELVPLVEDLASKTGKSLPEAATAVGKAFESGATKGLKAFGIEIKLSKDPATRLTQLIGELNRVAGGFSKTQGKQFAGQLTIMRNELKHTEEEVGRGAIPVIKQFGSIVGGAADVVLKMDDATGGAVGKFAAYGAAALLVGGAVSTVTGLAIKLGTNLTILKAKLGGTKAATIETAGADDTLAASEGTATASTETLGAAAVTTTGEITGLGVAGVGAAGDFAGLTAAGIGLTGILGRLAAGAAAAGIILGGMWDSKPAPKQDTDALKRLSDAEDLLSKSGIDAGKAQSEFSNAIHTSNPAAAVAAWGKQAGLSATQIKVLDQAFTLLFPHLDKLKRGADAAAASVKSGGDADYAAAQQSDAYAAKLKDLGDAAKSANDHLYDMATAVNATHDAQRGALSAVLTYQDDIAGLTDKQKAYTDAVKAHGAASPEAAAAQRAYAEAALQVSGDVDSAKNAILDSAKASAHGSTNSALYKKSLEEFASTLKPGSPLRIWLDQYIAELHTVPTNITTNVDIQAASHVQGGGVRAGHSRIYGAEGGLFNKPTLKIIGEAGPEALIPLSKPARAAEILRQAGLHNLPTLRLGGRGAGGDGPTIVNHYTINVSTLDAPTAGHALVSILAKHTSTQGPLPKKITGVR